MDLKFAFEYFIIYIFPIATLVFGSVGNVLGLILCSSKKLKKIGSLNIYRYLFITDGLFLPQILITYLGYSFSSDLTLVSVQLCKIAIYANYFAPAISPWLLVFISFEKFISIKFHKNKLLKQKKVQNIFYLILAA